MPKSVVTKAEEIWEYATRELTKRIDTITVYRGIISLSAGETRAWSFYPARNERYSFVTIHASISTGATGSYIRRAMRICYEGTSYEYVLEEVSGSGDLELNIPHKMNIRKDADNYQCLVLVVHNDDSVANDLEFAHARVEI